MTKGAKNFATCDKWSQLKLELFQGAHAASARPVDKDRFEPSPQQNSRDDLVFRQISTRVRLNPLRPDCTHTLHGSQQPAVWLWLYLRAWVPET
jgi:hypothetical protein